MDDSHISDGDTDEEILISAAAAYELILLLQRKGIYPKRTRIQIDRLAADFLDKTKSQRP
jgi:hypothetical protein